MIIIIIGIAAVNTIIVIIFSHYQNQDRYL